MLWKTPMIGEMRLALAPVLSGASEEITPVATRLTGNAAVQTWRLRLPQPAVRRGDPGDHCDGASNPH